MSKENNSNLSRRNFCRIITGSIVGSVLLTPDLKAQLFKTGLNEDLFTFIHRTYGMFNQTAYRQLIGAANYFKEGDQIIGVAASDEMARVSARSLLANSKISDLLKHPLFQDNLYDQLVKSLNENAMQKTSLMTLGDLKKFLLSNPEEIINPLLDGLSSDVIGCVVKLMTNEELTIVASKIFNPLANSNIGAKGYMGARIQPNSPTDNTDDIIWQIFSGWSYAVGDVVLGVNPVSSLPESVSKIENTLLDLRQAFKIEEIIPHSVLAHIDIQAEIEKIQPQSTGIWFQSLAGSDLANATFDITLEKMLNYANQRNDQYGFYFETGQGADFTNGSGQGTDMVIHESRKYGFIRLLKTIIAQNHKKAGRTTLPWVHVNDVAGFIGPEVFRTKEQLVRCCLEDIVMGKLHGLTIGLDICSTLHMDITLDDLDWCQDQLMPANPTYLMALPTKNDPMLGYLTTAYQDHVRLREKLGFKINNLMWEFFQRIGIIDNNGRPSSNFGQPLWVWYKYMLAKGDTRSKDEIYLEGKKKMREVRNRGVYLAEGFNKKIWKMEPKLEREIRTLYADAKKSIWVPLSNSFISQIPNSVSIKTKSFDRTDYILHPQTGEQLDDYSAQLINDIKSKTNNSIQVQILISDGLNANAIMDKGHLAPYLLYLKKYLTENSLICAPQIFVIKNGRVRAGYRIGEILFGNLSNTLEHKGIIHIIGERPGTMHHTFSSYISMPKVSFWNKGNIDHNITRVVSGIADTALNPKIAAQETLKILGQLLKL